MVEFKSLQEEIAYLKNLVEEFRYDYLTKLPQRYDFERDLQKALDLSEPFLLMMCDINGLHTVNRKYGYAAGDALIIQTARALTHEFGNYGKFYKAGGADEFFGILSPAAVEKSCSIHNTECACVLSTDYSNKHEIIDAVDSLVIEKKALSKRRRTD